MTILLIHQLSHLMSVLDKTNNVVTSPAMINEDISLKTVPLLQVLPGEVGILIQTSPARVIFQHNARQVFPAASLIKLPILLEYYSQVSHGLLDPFQRLELIPEDIVGGSGILQELVPGCLLTLQDLATVMVIVSDNTATNILIDLLGMANINQTIKAFDLKDTILQRKMLDWTARGKGLENLTSPADMAKLLDIFLYSERLSSAAKIGILEIMKKQRVKHKLPAKNPPGVAWAHKTGELPGVEHDVGILEIAGRTLIVAVLTKALENNKDGSAFISELGRIVYDAFLFPE